MYQKIYINTLPIVQLSFNTRSRFDQRSMVYHVFNKNVKRCPSTTFRRLSTRIGLRIAKMFCIRKENKMSFFLQLYMSEKCEYYIFLGSDLWWLLDQKLEVVTLLKFDAKTTPRYQIFRKVSWIFLSNNEVRIT